MIKSSYGIANDKKQIIGALFFKAIISYECFEKLFRHKIKSYC